MCQRTSRFRLGLGTKLSFCDDYCMSNCIARRTDDVKLHSKANRRMYNTFFTCWGWTDTIQAQLKNGGPTPSVYALVSETPGMDDWSVLALTNNVLTAVLLSAMKAFLPWIVYCMSNGSASLLLSACLPMSVSRRYFRYSRGRISVVASQRLCGFFSKKECSCKKSAKRPRVWTLLPGLMNKLWTTWWCKTEYKQFGQQAQALWCSSWWCLHVWSS